MLVIKVEDSSGIVGVVGAEPHNFSTGSVGFQARGKIKINGKKYQVQFQAVEIGSKAQAQKSDETDEADTSSEAE